MPPVPRDIQSLVARARGGDAAAFDRLVEQNATALIRFLTNILGGDMHAAHDVAQDSFLVAWRTLPRLVEPRYFRAWLFRVAYHRAITWLRRRGPQGTPFKTLPTPNDEEPPFLRGWGVGTVRDPSDEVTPRLHAALHSMPLRYAAPINLHYFKGLGTRETAVALGIAHSTLKMRLVRARSILKDKMRKVLRPERAAPPPDPAPSEEPAEGAVP